ncbi:MAG: tripartite tricarboxylate transporter substrate binding protein, partial [Burkholderiales bacterium]|nr:tripartite tricarboxylate transporter substrate binding protein [Burkholderiales bacterium]
MKTLIACCGALLLGAYAQLVTAQAYPTKPIRIIVHFPPGGPTDLVARAVGQKFGEAWGQQVIVENRPGAGGVIGVDLVVRAAPDGHTLLVAYSTPIFYAHHIFAKVPYDIRKDFEFISQLAATSLVMMVNADVPAKNMKEFMAWAQQNKGKVNYGSYGQGSPGHLMSAYLSDSRKLDMTHVAYKSEAPHIQDLAGGVVSWGLGTIAAAQGALKDKRIRPIAIYGPKRLAELPDVATMAEQGFADPEFNTVAWF